MNNLVDQAALRRVKEHAWEDGFLAGQAYGQALACFDPGWDLPSEEPSRPRNPYRVEAATRTDREGGR